MKPSKRGDGVSELSVVVEEPELLSEAGIVVGRGCEK
jgi:hypothetical protein